MCDLTDLILGVIGLGIIIGMSYLIAWDLPWLMIFIGLYLVGIVIAWSWREWVGYPDWWILPIEFFGLLIGFAITLSFNFNPLTNAWYSIPYAPPLVILVICVMVGSAVYFIRNLVKH